MPAETFALPNVYGLITRPAGGAVLIQRRWKPETDPDNLGKWELPGGKWRADESAQDCLRRELQEECGVALHSVGGSFARYEHLGQPVETSTPTLVVKGHVSALVVYSGHSDDDPIAEGDGSRDARFMAVEELKTALRQEPDTFTALTFSALTELVARGVL
ncbi:MAG TPA: NUDIX domain-containing protein [Mycobacteriales bacterium]|nr:NUDIX domain-containing protein [Mycobacteriales bacterium]